MGKWVFKPTQNNTELKMLMTNSKKKLVFDKVGNMVDKIKRHIIRMLKTGSKILNCLCYIL